MNNPTNRIRDPFYANLLFRSKPIVTMGRGIYAVGY
jgi:hypothetical protein